MKKQEIQQLSLPQIGKWNELESTALDSYSLSTVQPGHQLQNFPFRASFYGIGICKAGEVILEANLDSYHVQPNSLIVMGPDIIRRWSNQSFDYCTQALFFTEDFFIDNQVDTTLLSQFKFFHSGAAKIIKLSTNEADYFYELLLQVDKLLAKNSNRKKQMVRAYVYILLNLTADCYERHFPDNTGSTKVGANLVERFKQLLIKHFMEMRLVSDYANLLFVTGKHLSESVKIVTGKTARQLIHDIILLEAKVSLKQTSLTISQIADIMHFSDVSSFCKFFKRVTGISPAQYRR